MIGALKRAEEAVLADCQRRVEYAEEFERSLTQLVIDESNAYLSAIDIWSSDGNASVCIARDEASWQALRDMVSVDQMWYMQNLLRQVEVSICSLIELCEQAKKSYPYGKEQLFLEEFLHEKKKSRRKVDELLRYVQNRIWEEIGFAPYTY